MRLLLASVPPSGAAELLTVSNDVFAEGAVSVEYILERAETHPFVANEIVVATKLSLTTELASRYTSTADWAAWTNVADTFVVRNLMTVERGAQQSASLIRLQLGPQGNPLEVVQHLAENEQVLWSSPNFVHMGGDPRDFIPNDPLYAQQYHHPLMQNHLAWDITLGNPDIIIGVTDDGVLLNHADLAANIWVNPGEIPGNGIDNDGNGYIDDVNGWNFSGNNNDPNPNFSDADHGTHVAGIAAGVINNGIGVAGTAGLATIMPLQFYRGGSSWTAAVINETYVYAANNGAHIVTTSFNVDGWVGDPVFLAGLQYMYDSGVLHFNSAGNNNQLNPPRQSFDQSLFVASTNSQDVRANSSNYGTGIDIAAPGVGILSTILNNSYGTKSGTSMATPNAAGAAALIWGANPGWNRYQVAAQLLYFADNIDAQNPNFVGLLGAGRVNPYRALINTLPAPQVQWVNGLPLEGSTTANWNVDSFTVAFNQVMEPSTVNGGGNVFIREAGPDGIHGTADDQIFSVVANRVYQVGTNQLNFEIESGSLPPGDYQLVMSAGLQNPFGASLDGNGDGVGGDDFVYSFSLRPEIVSLPAPGALIYSQQWSGDILLPQQEDHYFVSLSAGQTVVAEAIAGQGLVPVIQVKDAQGNLIGTGEPFGSNAVTPVISIPESGRYQISIMGDSNSAGVYQAQLVYNAGVGLSALGGVSNDSLETAQEIDSTVIALGTGNADRLAVASRIPVQYELIHYEGFESGSLNSQWTATASNSAGRLRLTGQFGTAAGSAAMMLDRINSSGNTRVQATWTVNLSGLSSAVLRFSEASYGDRVHTMPATFSTNSNSDGVAISANGSTWYRVWSPTATQPAGVWTEHEVDLMAAAANAGISLNSNFRIRFQQFDNGPIPNRGRGYDEIRILEVSDQSLERWYSFGVKDGESVSIAASLVDSAGDLTVELYDEFGNLLSTGVTTDYLASYISGFQDQTNNGLQDTYFVRVVGVGGQDYTLAVTRNAEFEREPNNSLATAQSIDQGIGVLGFAGNSQDFYRFAVNSGEQIRFSAHFPGAETGLLSNGLVTDGNVHFQMELLNPAGQVVSTGNSIISHTADTSGDWFIRVYGLSGNTGEYFLQKDAFARYELGTVTIVGLDIVSVSFDQTFQDPIVIVSPASNNHHPIPVIPSVTGVHSNGFQVYVNDWNTQFDDTLFTFEEVSYLVVERGVNFLPDGTRFEAGSFIIDDAPILTIPFEENFNSTPVVVTSAVTLPSQTPRVPRLFSVSTENFQIQTQFGQAAFVWDDDQIMVSYLAMEPGRYDFDDFSIEVGITPNEVTHMPYQLDFTSLFPGTPVFLASLQTFNDPDPATLRLISRTNEGATFFVQEEQTLNPGMEHGEEQVGYLAIWRNGSSEMRSSFLSTKTELENSDGFIWFLHESQPMISNEPSQYQRQHVVREPDGVFDNLTSSVIDSHHQKPFASDPLDWIDLMTPENILDDTAEKKNSQIDQFFAFFDRFEEDHHAVLA